MSTTSCVARPDIGSPARRGGPIVGEARTDPYLPAFADGTAARANLDLLAIPPRGERPGCGSVMRYQPVLLRSANRQAKAYRVDAVPSTRAYEHSLQNMEDVTGTRNYFGENR
jgi:hypothetical protein